MVRSKRGAVAALLLCCLAASAAADDAPKVNPRALEPGQGLMLVTVAPPGPRIEDPEHFVTTYESLQVGDLATGKVRSYDLERAAPSSSSAFLVQLPAGRHRLVSASYSFTVTYNVGNAVMTQTVVVPVSLASLALDFEVVADRVTDLGGIALRNIVVKKGLLGQERTTDAARVRRNDPGLFRRLALAYPGLAPALSAEPIPLVRDPELDGDWAQLRPRLMLIGAPRAVGEGRMLLGRRFGELLLWDGADGVEEASLGYATALTGMVRARDGAYYATTEHGSVFTAVEPRGPWRPLAPPSATTVRASSIGESADGVFVVTIDGLGWTPGFIDKQVWTAGSIGIHRLGPDGTWARLHERPLPEQPVAFAAVGDRVVTLSAKRVQVLDPAGATLAEGRLEAEHLSVTADGVVLATDDRIVYEQSAYASRDRGKGWSELSDRKVPYQARFSPVVPLADGRSAFTGRKRLRDFKPLYVHVGKGDEFEPIGDALPRACEKLGPPLPLGTRLFFSCNDERAIHVLDLTSGAWRRL